jgi:hypothetical protein
MMIEFLYRQRLPLIRLYSVFRVQALSNWLIILEQYCLKACCYLRCRQALIIFDSNRSLLFGIDILCELINLELT